MYRALVIQMKLNDKTQASRCKQTLNIHCEITGVLQIVLFHLGKSWVS